MRRFSSKPGWRSTPDGSLQRFDLRGTALELGIDEALAGKENAPQPVAAAAPSFTMDDDF